MGAIVQSLHGRRIAVCVGSGGVGKTTVAAALGVRRALDGARVLVCTIDPARRLANALGLEALGNVEAHVGEHKFREAGLAPRGLRPASRSACSGTCASAFPSAASPSALASRRAGSMVQTRTFPPSSARPTPRAAATVVFPTPPGPTQTAMRFPRSRSASSPI